MLRKDLPHFAQSEFDEKVQKLFDYIKQLEEEIKALKEENARLKKVPGVPSLLPAKPGLGSSQPEGDATKKRGGSKPGTRRSKTGQLPIHQTKIVQPEEEIPEGSIFRGYQDYVVQNLKMTSDNTLYRLARWESPDGQSRIGVLPSHVEGHFGSELRSYILYQHTQCRVTEPHLLEQLKEFGVEISSGQLHAILTQGHDQFHQEKSEILDAGLCSSSFIQVDDTGARHNGKNGYCTVICNSFFAYFETTLSKSRINFLEILRGKNQDYEITEESIDYFKASKLPLAPLSCLALCAHFQDKRDWEQFLLSNGITQERHIRIATEGALIGALMTHGFNPHLAVMSDDAGQFNVFLHVLCWIHAERHIKKLEPYTPEQVEAQKQVRSLIWDYYDQLTAYKLNPQSDQVALLDKKFDEIFQQKTCYVSLNLVLKRIHENKDELLVILKRPDVPLHNNQSESDIREKVQRRKISVTFSDAGKRCRDTFSSLKKTCRKNGISFWRYLNDRISGGDVIPNLGEIIRQRAAQVALHPI